MYFALRIIFFLDSFLLAGLPPAMEQPLPPGGPLSDFGGLGGIGLPPPPPDTPHFIGQPPEMLSQRSSPDGVGGMILPHGGQ